ncbi:hypothetical protein K469DRAFT_358251 [Zopfia rhizophila CBS 207.26]|uniref:Secreted protein n=1 Tax=Zopfia rhizophila CBS 207.26 TaxID=1314779 RepID=A0A6A6DHP1_9PEZI|nr:hypothetical protein K469DRAFT_358251 [Zopfia rhizophila CBS 207.26]
MLPNITSMTLFALTKAVSSVAYSDFSSCSPCRPTPMLANRKASTARTSWHDSARMFHDKLMLPPAKEMYIFRSLPPSEHLLAHRNPSC